MFKKIREKIECKKLTKEFERIKKIRIEKNKSNTQNYIAGEYIMFCMLNRIPVENIENVVDYTFKEGIKNGSIDKYTLLTKDTMELMN